MTPTLIRVGLYTIAGLAALMLALATLVAVRAARRPAVPGRPATERPRPGRRGWPGRGGGRMLYLAVVTWFRATSVQVCGFNPFAVGAGAPLSGVPIGPHQAAEGTVCCDPISWFRDGFISSPSEFVGGLNGNGKSSFVRKQLMGLAGMGTRFMIMGDLKPDYVALTRALGGQVIEVGPGRGKINVLDPGESAAAAALLADAADDAERAGAPSRATDLRQIRTQVLAEAHARAVSMTTGLLTILGNGIGLQVHEDSVLDKAVRLLEDRHAQPTTTCACPQLVVAGMRWHRTGCPDRATPPELRDLLHIVTERPADLLAVALATSDAHFDELTLRLRQGLTALVEGSSRLGDTFSGQTTVQMRRDRHVCVDIHAIDDTQEDLQAAVLLATWAWGFATIGISYALSDAGLEKRQHWIGVVDELWRVLQSGEGMVRRMNAFTRLDRQKGVGRIYITHTMSDMLALPEAEARLAKGFVERSGIKVFFGLPDDEIALLRGAGVHFSQQETNQITSWTTPESWAEGAPPPGLGRCIIKVGRHRGLPVKVRFTAAEADLHDTNQKWHPAAAAAAPAGRLVETR